MKYFVYESKYIYSNHYVRYYRSNIHTVQYFSCKISNEILHDIISKSYVQSTKYSMVQYAAKSRCNILHAKLSTKYSMVQYFICRITVKYSMCRITVQYSSCKISNEILYGAIFLYTKLRCNILHAKLWCNILCAKPWCNILHAKLQYNILRAKLITKYSMVQYFYIQSYGAIFYVI